MCTEPHPYYGPAPPPLLDQGVTRSWHPPDGSGNTKSITLEHHWADLKVVCNHFISECYSASTYTVVLFLLYNWNGMPSKYSCFHFIGELLTQTGFSNFPQMTVLLAQIHIAFLICVFSHSPGGHKSTCKVPPNVGTGCPLTVSSHGPSPVHLQGKSGNSVLTSFSYKNGPMGLGLYPCDLI